MLAVLADDQWRDTREIALAVGAPMKRVRDVLTSLQGQGIVRNANFPPMMGVWALAEDL